MRYITNRIATNGFCAVGTGVADYCPAYDDRLRSLEIHRVRTSPGFVVNRTIVTGWPLLRRRLLSITIVGRSCGPVAVVNAL